MISQELLFQFQEDLRTTHGNLSDAVRQLGESQFNLYQAKVTLQWERDAILREHADDISALGKNEAVREAALRERTKAAQDAVEFNEGLVIHHRCAKDMAQMEMDYWKQNVRLLELAKDNLDDTPEGGAA